jgi:hypothetical protein
MAGGWVGGGGGGGGGVCVCVCVGGGANHYHRCYTKHHGIPFLTSCKVSLFIISLPTDASHAFRYRVSRKERQTIEGHEKTSQCFAILGFDIFLDRKLKPYVHAFAHCGGQ